MSESINCHCCKKKAMVERIMVVDDCDNCGLQIRDGSDLDLNKIKADAIRECSEQNFIDDEVTYMMIQNRANKLERGGI